jgi:hypothetical protein
LFKYITIIVFLGLSILGAEEQKVEKQPNLVQLKAQKEALKLKLEAYALKKKIIEMENFFEKNRVEKKEREERERALIKLKRDLRSKSKHHVQQRG